MIDKVLEVKNLTKNFGKVCAVDNISFSIKEGEILGLLGPNGAGKTTTIQMLLGALTPSSGEINYFGKEFNENREEVLNKINFCSSYIRYPWKLTVNENLDVSARLYGVKDRKKRINKLLKIFDIQNFQNKPASSLSSGQTMRVMLAKAFINFPKLILLDEPTSSLDPEIAEKVRNFLKSEQDNFKVSMLLTSHNMAEVESMCDRVIFLNKGKIIAEDTPVNLAKKIEISRVDLIVDENIDRVLEICTENEWEVGVDKHHMKVELKEKDIPKLLTVLGEEKVVYSEISIEKPDLEDFFLKISKERNKK
ncbi:MAG: ABC transporter ATP-binding protein [Patescibacteria group bacterium]